MSCDKGVKSSANEIVDKGHENYEDFIKWGFKICGSIAFLAMYLPILVISGFGSYSINVLDIMGLMRDTIDMSIGYSIGVLLLIFAMLLHAGFSILLIVFSDADFLKTVATLGVLILICVRILLEAAIGIEGGAGFVHYGSGWWLMILPVLAVAAAAWVVTIRKRKNSR